jgi:hypothetical protein
MRPAELARSGAFQTGLHYLDAGYYWEAHELLEPVWMALPETSSERRVVQALIQFANACLKERMDRPKAALRLCAIVRDLLGPCTEARLMGLEVQALARRTDSLETMLRAEKYAK